MVSADEPRELSVSEAINRAKGALESVVVTLVGEVSEFSNKAGYKAVYFTVKDQSASLPCMMWMNRFNAAGVAVRIGSLVQLTGRFTLYPAKGRMNFDVFSIALAGEGKLREQVAQLAKKLQSEGLMDAARKRPLPQMPETIGLVTSPRGAAVRDVLRTLRRRYPLAAIAFAGVPVEGASAPENLAAGIAAVAKSGAEVILLVRGGGSFEDLMPFNDETLARCIASCPVPVVTGIGHEPDTSIADMVADMRASTPTAAAEVVAPDFETLRAHLGSCGSSLDAALTSRIERTRAYFDLRAQKPFFADPKTLLASEMISLDASEDRLHRAIPAGLQRDRLGLELVESRLGSLGRGMLASPQHKVELLRERMMLHGESLCLSRKNALALRASRINDLSPLAVLGRGYSIARDERGGLVRQVADVHAGERLNVTVSDGVISCTVENVSMSDFESMNLEV